MIVIISLRISDQLVFKHIQSMLNFVLNLLHYTNIYCTYFNFEVCCFEPINKCQIFNSMKLNESLKGNYLIILKCINIHRYLNDKMAL